MDREEELIALYGLLGAILRLPARLRTQAAAWLAPEAPKGNGHGPRPPPIVNGSGVTPAPLRLAKRHQRKPTSTVAAERKLLAAMQENPGLSVIALANAAGSSRSATGERLELCGKLGDGVRKAA
jgi:hypothetical protein